VLDTDVLSDGEVREFGLPSHVPGADCNGRLGGKSGNHRGRPKKVPQIGHESERMDKEAKSLFEGALAAGLAGVSAVF